MEDQLNYLFEAVLSTNDLNFHWRRMNLPGSIYQGRPIGAKSRVIGELPDETLNILKKDELYTSLEVEELHKSFDDVLAFMNDEFENKMVHYYKVVLNGDKLVLRCALTDV